MIAAHKNNMVLQVVIYEISKPVFSTGFHTYMGGFVLTMLPYN